MLNTKINFNLSILFDLLQLKYYKNNIIENIIDNLINNKKLKNFDLWNNIFDLINEIDSYINRKFN